MKFIIHVGSQRTNVKLQLRDQN